MANKLFSELSKGTYSGATAYTVGDFVNYNGSSYACISNSTGNLPTDTNYWALLASKGATGATGATGAAGPEGLIWEGPWLTATSYSVDDAVSNGGSSYICIEAHTSGTFATDLAASKWELLAQKGDTGATGDTGPAGPGISDGDKGDITVSSSGTVWTIDNDTIGLDELSATGTPSATTFLRGDNTWSVPAGSGDVSKVGTPVDNQVGVWTGDGTIEGDANLTFSSGELVIGTNSATAGKLLLKPGDSGNWHWIDNHAASDQLRFSYGVTAGTIVLALLKESGGFFVGTGSASGRISSNGNQDIIIQTGNATTGTITITDGADGNIDINPNGTGNILLGNFTFDGDQTVGAGQDNYVLTYDNATGLISLEAASGGTIDGSGTTNELVYWVDANTVGALAVATYPSLTELSYVKGVTSAIQTQINTKAPSASPTFTGTVILPKTLEIQDTTGDHQYVLAVSELAADRTVTLPLLTGADEFVFKDHAVTLTNKTIALGSNTVSGTKAQFDTAVTDGNFLYVGDITQYTDEMAQDAVGGMAANSTFIDLAYVDGTPSLTASLSATGTPSASTFLRGDNTWATPVGGSGGGYFVDQTPDNGTYGLLAGSVNSSNTVFTVSQGSYSTGTLVVYVNGQLQTQGASNDYQETTPASGTFTFITAPTTGDIVTAQYQTAAGNTGGVTIKNEGSDLTTAVSSIDFVGGSVNATNSGAAVTVTISGLSRSISNINTNTTAGSTAGTDYVYFVTGTTTLTLPTAVGNTNRYTVKSVSGTTVVAADGAETIDGSSTIGIANEDSVDLVSNNTEWKVV